MTVLRSLFAALSLTAAPIVLAPTASARPAPVQPGPVQPGPVQPARSGPAQEVVVDLSCEPAEAEIGEPVTWTLIVEHPRDGAVTVSGDGFESPDGRRLWVELGERHRTVAPVDGGGGDARTRTTFTWTVCALDSGERTLEGLRVEVDLPDRVVSKAVEGATLFVRAALGDGEDAPRPLAGFRPAPPGASVRTSRWLLPGLILLAVSALALVVKSRWRGPVVLPDLELPLEELEALAESLGDEPDAAAELGYGLSHLLRRTADARLGEPRAPLTDVEWASRLETDARLPDELRFGLARLVRDLEPLKYGGRQPTRFALRELLERARDLLDELELVGADEVTGHAPLAAERGAA